MQTLSFAVPPPHFDVQPHKPFIFSACGVLVEWLLVAQFTASWMEMANLLCRNSSVSCFSWSADHHDACGWVAYRDEHLSRSVTLQHGIHPQTVSVGLGSC